MNKAVHKFGGSSLSSAARYHAVANTIISQCQSGDLIVVSASGKTTNTLIKLWRCYQQANVQGSFDCIKLLKIHQVELITELLTGEQQIQALKNLNQEIKIIINLINQEQLIEAQLLAHGELWSARLLARYLTQLAHQAIAFDARELLLLVDGQLQHSQNKLNCRALQADKFNILTGFIAKNELGNTVTLGRNGSDYSATLFARYCDAQSVTIWTDTPGVYSTDPHKVSRAIKYSKICREQANLLSKLGCQMLHTKTLKPLKGTDIKLVVRSSFDRSYKPTEIVKYGSAKQKYFLTTLNNYDLVKITQLADGEISELSRLIQHSLHHFNIESDTYLVIPAEFTSIVRKQVLARTNLVESNLFGLGIICPNGAATELTERASQLLKQYNINVLFTYSKNNSSQSTSAPGDYGLILCEQAFDAEILAVLHEKLINDSQELAAGSVFSPHRLDISTENINSRAQ